MDVFHLVALVVTIGADVFLKYSGHSDPTSSQALLSLAAFLGGSQVRASLTKGDSK